MSNSRREEFGGKTAAEYMFEKALLALKDRDRERALNFFSNCLKADPDHPEAWMMRGNVEHAEGRFLNALLHHDRAVALAPHKYDAWNNRGLAFADLGLFASARECFEKSIEILDAYEARMNLANMYCHLMELEKAEEQYRAALKTNIQDYEAHIQLGLALLGQGRWKEAFPEYEWRLLNSPHPPREEKWPRWRGEDVDGKTILVWPEQGVGDEIMMLRFAPEITKLGGRVIVEARPPMYRAAQTLENVDQVVVQHSWNGVPDYQCALTDIPMVLGTEPDTIPSREGYLYQKVSPRLNWLNLPRDTYNVGICWNSGRRPLQPEVEASFKTKSIPIEWIEPFVQKGVQLYSLQKEHADYVLMRKLGIIDWMDQVGDFADTAALISSLDLVISVDTSVAHLAGAMGRPVWNFVRHSGYWPWMRENRVTNWYDSMRIFRQPSLSDWDQPIKWAAADLGELAAQKMEKAA